jgi:dipeptidyl aminopeptidase/acylaminoacyl peptidase
MKKIIHILILLVGIQMMNAQNVPLLDREIFFGNPEISGGQLSPDGKWISFMKEYEGIMNIWVKAFDEPFENARPLTDSKRPLYGYFWTEDGQYILYAKDKDGDENVNVFSVKPSAKAPAGKVPESRNLTPLKDVTVQIFMVSRKNPDLLMIGLNDRDKAWHDLYSLKISTGELKMIHENKDRITGYNFDWDENLRVLNRTDEKGTTQFLFKEGDKLTPIYETLVTESAYISNWNEDNSEFYLITNKGELDLSTLFSMNPKTKKMTKIESDPKGKVDFGSLFLDRNTRKIISTQYTSDKTDVYWKDKKWEENYQFLKSKFPGREVDFQSSTKDYSKFLVTVWGDKYATQAYFFDAKTKDLILQYTPRPKLKEVEEHLAEMTPISYKSSDGLLIPGYLTLPKGSNGKNLPLVVFVHGGPKGPRDYWGFDANVQFLANRGYAVLQPNFRASGGYGKKFENAGDLQWGKLMQDDITWGVQHLIKEGIADKNKVVIMGGSYGGYATLAGLTFTPDIYAGGVDIVGPSNIFTLLDSVPEYWESFRAALYAMVGNPKTPEGQKLIREASPLFSVDNIKKPLLIIQGANDPRVKQAESDQIVVALRDKGKRVDYLLADDEGHGFRKPVNNMAMYAEVEKFLSEVIGGRYQKEMPTDVAKRLGELRVDVSKVKYEPVKKSNVEATLPKIQNEFKEGTSHYDLKIELQGQAIPMDLKRTVKKSGENWVVRDEAVSPMGNSIDEMEYSSDLKPIKRTLDQGSIQIPVVYQKDLVKMTMMGNVIEMMMEGAYIADGAGYDRIIAGLPLKEGYTLSYLVPDLISAKTKQMDLKVVGKEKIGNVDTWKVEMVNPENTTEILTMWIDPTSKESVKTIQILPAMGNAVMTILKK